VKIREAHPVAVFSSEKSLPLSYAPIVSVWLSKEATGYAVYVLKSSPMLPSVLYSNVSVATWSQPYEARISVANSDPGPASFLVWVDSKDTLHGVHLAGAATVEAETTYQLPIEGARFLGTPYVDQTGSLNLVVASRNGEEVGIVRWPSAEPPSCAVILLEGKPVGPHSLFWGADDVLSLVWAAPDGQEVYLIRQPLSEMGKKKPGLERLLAVPHEILAVNAYQQLLESGDGYERKVLILSYDDVNDMFYRVRVDLSTKKMEEDAKFALNHTTSFTLVQSALTSQNTPGYLFIDPKGQIYFSNGGGMKLALAKDKRGAPISIDSFPALVTTGRLSRRPGFYLRYIDQGKKLEFVRLE